MSLHIDYNGTPTHQTSQACERACFAYLPEKDKLLAVTVLTDETGEGGVTSSTQWIPRDAETGGFDTEAMYPQWASLLKEALAAGVFAKVRSPEGA